MATEDIRRSIASSIVRIDEEIDDVNARHEREVSRLIGVKDSLSASLAAFDGGQPDQAPPSSTDAARGAQNSASRADDRAAAPVNRESKNSTSMPATTTSSGQSDAKPQPAKRGRKSADQKPNGTPSTAPTTAKPRAKPGPKPKAVGTVSAEGTAAPAPKPARKNAAKKATRVSEKASTSKSPDAAPAKPQTPSAPTAQPGATDAPAPTKGAKVEITVDTWPTLLTSKPKSARELARAAAKQNNYETDKGTLEQLATQAGEAYEALVSVGAVQASGTGQARVFFKPDA